VQSWTVKLRIDPDAIGVDYGIAQSLCFLVRDKLSICLLRGPRGPRPSPNSAYIYYSLIDSAIGHS
jgi:hypothetical protein